MTKEDKVKHWSNLLDENFHVATDLLKSKHLLQMVFFCHLTVETISAGFLDEI
ncbi:MAG: hypothetical protein FWF70_07165 [Bacteroidetes bacterium]|nr:hypothetical protein [Bacteroidota bacterium]MCL1968894.1 hypothetical protein [Bacteroidota bacterium]MCL1969009.1 hypothetical protein [Bacteroidota bacterium]